MLTHQYHRGRSWRGKRGVKPGAESLVCPNFLRYRASIRAGCDRSTPGGRVSRVPLTWPCPQNGGADGTRPPSARGGSRPCATGPHLRRRPSTAPGRDGTPASAAGALNPAGTERALVAEGTSRGTTASSRGGRVRGTGRPTTRVWVISAAQAAQTSARVHTWPTAGSCRSTSSTEPEQSTRVPSCAAHRCRRQPQAASGRTVAALTWAAACASAKRRRAAMSRDRAGMPHPEEQLTEAVRSR